MDLDGYLALIVPVVASCAARPLSERLPPRTATWLLSALAVVLACAATVTLGLLAVGGSLRLPQLAALGDLSPSAMSQGWRAGGPVAALAVVVLAVSAAAGCRAAVRQVLALRAAARTARELPGDDIVAVIEDEAVEAFALPGRPGRVVVSTGMLAVLDPDERIALLAHERAHLSGRHHLFRAAVRIAAATNPLLRPVEQAVIYASERWADERAAAVTGDRRRAAQAIGKAALAHRHRPGPVGSVALGIGLTSPSRPGPVPRRVAALLRPPPRRRLGLVAATLCLAAAATLAVMDAASDLHDLIVTAQVEHTGQR